MIEIHESTLVLVKEERRLTGLVIENLQKIYEQKIFLQMGYSSMFEYATKALSYSESSAYRRIAAVKMTKEIPEVKERIENGTLNLTNLTLAQSFFTKKPLTIDKKKEVLHKIENCTKRETEKVLASLGHISKPQEKLRYHSSSEASLQVNLDQATIVDLDKIKSLRSHKNPSMSYGELIKDMCKYMLKKLDPDPKKLRRVVQEKPDIKTHQSKVSTELALQSCSESLIQSRYISKALRIKIKARDNNQCTFVLNGRRCESKHLLEVDHVKPYSRGGETTFENLRLLCHAHHQWVDRYT